MTWTWADLLWNQLVGNTTTAADPAGAVLASYTNVFGSVPGTSFSIFYFALIGLALTMVYMKTRNFGNMAVVALLLMGGIAVLVPQTLYFAIITLIALGVAYILYKVFK